MHKIIFFSPKKTWNKSTAGMQNTPPRDTTFQYQLYTQFEENR